MKKIRIIISSLLVAMMLFLLPACGMGTDTNKTDGNKNDTKVSDSIDKNNNGTSGDLKDDVNQMANGAGDVVKGAAEGTKDMVDDLTDGVDQGTKDLEKAYNSVDKQNQ